MPVKSRYCVFILSGLFLLLNSPIASAVTYSQGSGNLDRATISTNCTSLTAVKKPDFVILSGSGSTYELSATKLVFHYWVTLDCDGQQVRFKYTTDYGGNMATRIARALLERMDTRHINVFAPVGSSGFGILRRTEDGDAVKINPATTNICVAIGKLPFPLQTIGFEIFSIKKDLDDAQCRDSLP